MSKFAWFLLYQNAVPTMNIQQTIGTSEIRRANRVGHVACVEAIHASADSRTTFRSLTSLIFIHGQFYAKPITFIRFLLVKKLLSTIQKINLEFKREREKERERENF